MVRVLYIRHTGPMSSTTRRHASGSIYGERRPDEAVINTCRMASFRDAITDAASAELGAWPDSQTGCSRSPALKGGGEGGIRTHGEVSPTHAFQACSLSHSDTSPREACVCRLLETARDDRPPGGRSQRMVARSRTTVGGLPGVPVRAMIMAGPGTGDPSHPRGSQNDILELVPGRGPGPAGRRPLRLHRLRRRRRGDRADVRAAPGRERHEEDVRQALRGRDQEAPD